MQVKSVLHEKENLYGIKIQLHESDKYDFNLGNLKRNLIPILGISVDDCILESYDKETDIVEFIVSCSRQIRYQDVFNAINILRHSGKYKS